MMYIALHEAGHIWSIESPRILVRNRFIRFYVTWYNACWCSMHIAKHPLLTGKYMPCITQHLSRRNNYEPVLLAPDQPTPTWAVSCKVICIIKCKKYHVQERKLYSTLQDINSPNLWLPVVFEQKGLLRIDKICTHLSFKPHLFSSSLAL